MADSGRRSTPPSSFTARADVAGTGAGDSGASAKLTLDELTDAFTTYGADLDLACGTLRQCAVEINVVIQAMFNDIAPELVLTTLQGIAQRMDLAAKLASEETSL